MKPAIRAAASFRRAGLLLSCAVALLLPRAASAQSLLYGSTGTAITNDGTAVPNSGNGNGGIIPDGSGGTYVIWSDNGGFATPLAGTNDNTSSGNGQNCNGSPCGNINIYLVHLSSSGSQLAWGGGNHNGTELFITDRYDQSQNIFISTYASAGGFVVEWTTSAVNTGGATFIQRYNSSGVAQLTGVGDGAQFSAGTNGSGPTANAAVLIQQGENFSGGAVASTIFYYLAGTGGSNGPITSIGVGALDLTTGGSVAGYPHNPTLTATTLASINSGGIVASPDPTDPGAISWLEGYFAGASTTTNRDIHAWRNNAAGTEWGGATGYAVTNSNTVGNGGAGVGPAGPGSNAVNFVWYDTRGGGRGFYAFQLGTTANAPAPSSTNGGNFLFDTPGSAVGNLSENGGNNVLGNGEFVFNWDTGTSHGGGNSSFDEHVTIVNPTGWVVEMSTVLFNGNSNVSLAVSGNSSSPNFWAAYQICNGQNCNNGNDNSGIQAWSSTGTQLFSSGFTETNGSAVYNGPLSLQGVGNNVVATFQYNDCNGSCVSDVGVQLISTITVVNAMTGFAATTNSGSNQASYQVIVAWTDPNATQASEYILQVALDAGFTQIVAGVTNSAGSICGVGNQAPPGGWAANACSDTVNGLSPSTQYYFRVQAQSGDTSSPFVSGNQTMPSFTGTVSATGLGNWTNTNVKLTHVTDALTPSGGPGACINNDGNNHCQDGVVVVSSGPGGDTFSVWTQDDGSGAAFNIVAQRVNHVDGTGSWNGGTGKTIVASVAENNVQHQGNSGPQGVQAVGDGAGGFIVTWSSSGGVGFAEDVNSAGTTVWGPLQYSNINAPFFDGSLVVSGSNAFFMQFGPIVAGNVSAYEQALALSNGAVAFGANGGLGASLGITINIAASDNIFDLTAPTPTGGVIAFVGPPSSAKGAGVTSAGVPTTFNGGAAYTQITNVDANDFNAVLLPDGAAGAYLIWVSTYGANSGVNAFRVTSAGAAATGFTGGAEHVTADNVGVNGANAFGGGGGFNAVATTSGPVATWALPGPLFTTVNNPTYIKASLVNPAGGSALWTTVIDTLPAIDNGNGFSGINSFASAVDTLSDTIVAYAYQVPASPTNQNSVNTAVVNDSGKVLVGPANLLQNMNQVNFSQGNFGTGQMTLAAQSAGNFVVAQPQEPAIFEQQVSTFTTLFSPTALSATSASTIAVTLAWTDPNVPFAATYTAQAAYDTLFSSGLISVGTTTKNYPFTGLNPDTTYYFRVQASSSGNNSPFSATYTTTTLTAAPTAVIFPSVSSSSLVAQWTTNNDGPGTRYQAVISTNAAFAPALSTTTVSISSVAFTSLNASTTYYVEVRAIGNGDLTAFSASSFTETLIGPPGFNNPTFQPVALSTDSLSIQWGTGGNGAGLQYRAALTSDPGCSSIVASSSTYNLNAVFGEASLATPLSPNSTFYACVQVQSGSGSLFVNLGSSSTDVSPPLAQQPSNVTAGSVQANWNGDGAGTVFTAQISSNNFANVFASSVTKNSFASFLGLTANTSYTFQVRAFGNDGQTTTFTPLPSTTTLLLPPAAAGNSFVSVNLASATVQWLNGGNGAGTIYVVNASTNANFNTIWFSSQTQNLTALFGATGAGPNLQPDTTFFFQVQSSAPANTSSFVNMGSTVTVAAMPTAVAPAFAGVTNSALMVFWSSGTAATGFNPASAFYKVQLATSAAFTTTTTSQITAGTEETFTGLAANTTYFARVSVDDVFSNSFLPFVALGSTATQTVPPTASAFTGVTTSSLTANWGANSNPAGTTYQVQVSTDPSFVGGTSTIFTTAVSTGFTGLLTNATYYGQVAAFSLNTGLYTSFTPLSSVITLANPPTAATVLATFPTDITLQWNANGNPFGTPYTLFTAQLSTSNTFTTITVFVSTNLTSTDFVGLTPNTTYFTRVNAQNSAGVATTYSVAAATSTNAAQPLTSNPSGVTTNSITANWTTNGNPAGTRYLVQIGTDPAFGSFNASSTTLNNAATFGGLAANTGFSFQVQALGVGGAATAFTSLPSTSTLILAPTAAATPISPVTTANVTVNWLTGGNAAGSTLYNALISTDNFASVNFTSATKNLNATFGAAGAGPTLGANTTYYFKVQATTTSSSSAFLVLGTTATPAAVPGAGAPLFTGVGNGALTVNWTANGNSATTQYTVQLATTAGFTTITASSATQNTSATFAGLTANSTYFAHIAPFSSENNALTAYTTLGSTETTTSPPTASAFTGVTTSSLTANWGANGNPAGTVYQVQITTDPALTTALSTIFTTSVSTGFTGLLPNATYYGQVAAFSVNTGLYTSFTQLLPTAGVSTLANAPTSPAVSAVTTTSEILGWNANSNPAGTLYTAQISTSNVFATINASTVTSNLSATFPGLVTNTTYFLRVDALNSSGAATAFAVATASATNATQPTTSSPTGVTPSAITANFGTNGNPAGTLFLVQIGTDPAFGSFNSSSQTANNSATFLGLVANTAYSFQVQALGFGGAATPFTNLFSTSTLLLTPTAAAAPISPVTTANVTVNWLTGGNAAGSTLYNALISTDNFASVNFTSATKNLNATFGAAGAGPTLGANTTYYFKVQATTTSSSSAFLVLGTTATPAAVPGAGAPLFTGVGNGALTVNWTANGNSATTQYTVQLATTAGFSAITASSATQNTSATFGGLTANSTYFAHIAPFSSENNALTAYTTLGSTETTTSPPTASAFTGVTASSLTANWIANGNPAGTVYQVQVSTDLTFIGGTSTIFTTAVSTGFTGLLPNATYYGQVAAFSVNTGLYTAFTQLLPTAGVSTLANAPTAPAVSAVTTTSEILGWNANSNPAGTLYTAQISTSNVFTTINAASATLNTSATFLGLVPNTTYFLRVDAFNSASTSTAFAVAAASSTNVAVPVTGTPTAVAATTLTENWGANGNLGLTAYVVQVGTDPAFATITASSQTLNVSAAFAGLTANTTYYGRVEALGNDGSATAFTVLTATSTPPLVPGASGTPFVNVSTFAATAQWTSGGNAPGTVYVSQISTSNVFATINFSSTTQNLTATYGTGGAGAPLFPNTTYYSRVLAQGTSNSSAFLTIGSTITPVSPPLAAAFTGVGNTVLTANWTANTNPGTTLYQVQIATTNAFTTVTSSQTTAVVYAFSGLTANTTYYGRVSAFGFASGFGAYTALGSTATTTSAPIASAFTGVTTSSLTANWTANGNPAGTVYQVQVSTDPTFVGGTTTNLTASLTSGFTGLLPNATYYGQVAAFSVNTGLYTAFTPLLPTAGVSTLANAPTAPAVSGVTVSSATLAWNANSNPAGTLYTAQISTSNVFTTINFSSVTANVSATFLGLVANTTYFLRVDALNSASAPTAFAVATASSTNVAVPVTGAPTAVAATVLTENWAANGNSATTLYTVQVGTDPAFVTFTASSQTLNVSAAFAGLTANTTYFSRVEALGNDGSLTAFTTLTSTSTPPLVPGASGTPFLNVSTFAATAQWTSGGNGAGTVYVAQLSTDSFATINFSSTTQNLTATYGTGGAGAPLFPNTTYYSRVLAQGTSNSSAFLTIGSTITPVSPPLAAAFTGVGNTVLTANWTANTNPGTTLYQVQIATTNAFTTVTSSQTTAVVYAFSGLTANTTYYGRVSAFGFASGFGAYTALGSTATTTSAPIASAFTGVTTSSLTANWTANGNPAGTVYQVQVSTDPTFVGGTTTNLTASLTSGFTGLLPNATYYGQVAAFSVNTGLYTAFTPLLPTAGVSTLANAPTAPAVSGVTVSSATLAWNANSNPAGTLYTAQISTSNVFATINFSSVTANVSATFLGLVANTTYFLRVDALNSASAPTAFAVATASSTNVAVPVTGAPTAVAATVLTENWAANGNSATTLYTVQVGTDPAFATITTSSLTLNVSAVLAGLTANTTYYGRVEALGNDGSLTAFTTLTSTTTPPLVPGAAGVPFVNVSTFAATAQWTSGGNGPGTVYVAQLSTDNFVTVNFSSTTQNLNATYGTGGAGAALLPNTTYYSRVLAQGTSNSSAFLTIGSTITPVDAPIAVPFSGVGNTVLQANWSTSNNPPTTLYQVQLSSNAGFTTISASIQTTALGHAFSGLTANTTYYGRVSPFGFASGFGAYVPLGSTATTTSPPTASAFTGVATSSVTANWTANGNPAGTVYQVQIATDPAFGSLTASALTVSLNSIFAGLSPNTTYYGQVAAFSVNTSTYTAYTGLGSSATLANAPTAPATVAVTTGSVIFAWNANSNPAGTVYNAQISTSGAFLPIYAASATANVSAAFSGLPANTTYFLRVAALNSSSVASAFAVATASSTNVAAPVSVPVSPVAATSVTANWTANNNSATTAYVAQISSNGFVSILFSSQTQNTSATFAGLTANTNYSLKVQALGNDGSATAFTALPSTTTLLASPALSTGTYSSVLQTGATIQWASGGNGAGTQYNAQISTDNFATVNFTSSTQNLFAGFGTGGAGPALAANTTYFFQIQSATTSNSSAFLALGSTATPAFVPGAVSVVSITSTTVSLLWSPNGNPFPGTTYQLWRDVSNTFPAPVATIVPATSTVVGGLAAGATYFFQVRTLGNNSSFTAFDAFVSTTTQPPAPGIPGTPTGAALGVSSISWNWTAAQFALSYQTQRAASGAVLLSTPTLLSFFDTGLATNTAYGIRVAGVNASGLGTLSAPTTFYTLAAPPAGTAVNPVAATSATLSWSLNTNPAGTTAEIQRSVDGVTFVSQGTTTVNSLADFSLLGCTTYYYRVRNQNGNGLLTSFDAVAGPFVTSNTVPAPPSGLSAQAVLGSRVLLNWTPSPTEGITGYQLFYDSGTGAINYAAPSALLQTLAPSATTYQTGVLVSSASYIFVLRAQHRCGVEETTGSTANAGAIATLNDVRADISGPASGHHVQGNNLTVSARLVNGTVAKTASVTFRYRKTGNVAWSTMTAVGANPNPATTSPYFMHWDVTGLLAGQSYDLSAVATDVAGSSDTSPDVVSVIVDPVAPDITENVGGGLIQTFNTGVGNTFNTSGAGVGAPLISIGIPGGLVNGTTAQVTIISGGALPIGAQAQPGGFTLIPNLFVTVNLTGGQSSLNGGMASVSFAAPNSLSQNQVIYSYDPVPGWSNVGLTTTYTPLNHQISVTTPHFSIFAVFAGAGATLGSDLTQVLIYPIPYRPNSGNRDLGGGNTGIFFNQLPASASIKIYTISGQLVDSVDASGVGLFNWDARNGAGRDVASGLYIAVITSPGSKTVTRKLLIIR